MNMAAKNSFCLDEEELSCPICFEEFNLCEKNRQPKLLLCLHTFCLACVETLRKYDGSLQCSICRTSHQIYRVGDLMDNYVIFEHLRIKQEYEDEKLAAQLKEEYDRSLKLLKEQEELDAQMARAEDEKNRLEDERIRTEQEKERERRRLEEIKHRAEEEMNNGEEELRRRRRIEEEDERREEVLAIINAVSFADELPEETESSSESVSREETESENEEDTDEEESFQDLEGVNEEEEEHEENHDETSIASIAEMEDYATLSSEDSEEEEEHSTEVISSDEDEMGTAPVSIRDQHTSCDQFPSTSPEPDLLSEEFSGVAQPHQPSKPQQDTLDKLLPSVKCTETADGNIIILDSSTDEASFGNGTPSPANSSQIILDVSNINTTTEDSEEEPVNYSSEEDRNLHLDVTEQFQRKPLRRDRQRSTAASDIDENCKLQ